MAFIGRGRTVAAPQAMTDAGAAVRAAQGSVLDPIVAIRHRMTLDPQQTATIDIVSGIGRDARRAHWPRRKVPGPPSGGPRVRPGVDAQLGDAAADQRHRVRCAALCAPRRLRHLRQCLAARGSRRPAAQPARAVGAVELRDLGRPADRAAADRRRGEHRPRAPAGAGARVLAAEGTGGRPRDLERGPRRLSAGPAGPDHGADRRRRRSARDGSAGRDLRAARGADRGRGPHPAAVRGARHHHRPPGKPGGAGHPPRSARRCGFRASCRRAITAAKLRPTTLPRARPDLVQRPRRIHARRPRVRRSRSRAGQATPAPWVNVLRESGFRHGRSPRAGSPTPGARTRTSSASRRGTTIR